LLLVQLGLYFTPKQDAVTSPEKNLPCRGIQNYGAGVVGVLSLILSVGFYINNRHKPKE
jgi:hypothetical protein